MNQKELLAAKLYDDMLENYRNFCSDMKDIEAADAFLDAAMLLCDLNMKNPFADLEGYVFQKNSAIKPSKTAKVVTAVLEEES